MISTDKARVSFLKKQQILNFKVYPAEVYGFIRQEDGYQVFTNGIYYIVLKGEYQFTESDIYYHGKEYEEKLTFNRGKRNVDLGLLSKKVFRLLPKSIENAPVEHSTDYINVKDLYCFLNAVQPVYGDKILRKLCCLSIDDKEYYFEAEQIMVALRLAFHDVKYVELDFNQYVAKLTSEENDNVAYIMHLKKWAESESAKYELCPIYYLD